MIGWLLAVGLLLLVVFLIGGVPQADLTAEEKRKRQGLFQKLVGGCIGHRGCRNLMAGVPQNTMAAFRTVVECAPSVLGIELDVHLSADRQLVVFHDSHLDDLLQDAPADAVVGGTPWAQLRSYRYRRELGTTASPLAFSPEETRIPLLEQVLRYCWNLPLDAQQPARKQPVVMIEIKQPGGVQTAQSVLSLLARLQEEMAASPQHQQEPSVYQRCWIASFSPAVLFRAKKLEPRIHTCFLVMGSPLSKLSRPQGHSEAVHLAEARDDMMSRGYGRFLLHPAVVWAVDSLWNTLVTSALLARLLSVSFFAVSSDLATDRFVGWCSRHSMAVLVWTINDPPLRLSLERKGAIVITDSTMDIQSSIS